MTRWDPRGEIQHGLPVDGRVPARTIRILSGQGSAGDFLEFLAEPPLPGGARQRPVSHLNARPVEKVVVDQEDMRVPVPAVAPGADQRQHRLPGPGATYDQVLPLLWQGASGFLLLAQVLDAR